MKQFAKLPKGFSFDEAAHVYSVDGRTIPGVTGILSAAGVVTGQEWFTPEARERGIAVHALAELELKDELDTDDLDERLRPYLFWFREWRERVKPAPLMLEQCVYFRDNLSTFEWAGRVDLVGCLKGHVAVVDFKTNNRPAWAGLQIAAYAGALKQMGVPVTAGWSVVLSDNKPVDMKEINLPVKWAEWCGVLKGLKNGAA